MPISPNPHHFCSEDHCQWIWGTHMCYFSSSAPLRIVSLPFNFESLAISWSRLSWDKFDLPYLIFMFLDVRIYELGKLSTPGPLEGQCPVATLFMFLWFSCRFSPYILFLNLFKVLNSQMLTHVGGNFITFWFLILTFEWGRGFMRSSGIFCEMFGHWVYLHIFPVFIIWFCLCPSFQTF